MKKLLVPTSMMKTESDQQTGIVARRLFRFESCERDSACRIVDDSEMVQGHSFPLHPIKPTSHCQEVLTTSTSDESLSSLSSVGEDTFDENDSLSEYSKSPRSIFQCYWSKSSGSKPLSLRPSSSEQGVERSPTSLSEGNRDDDDSVSSSCISYERSLRRNEGIGTPSTCEISPQRRNIFGNAKHASQSMSSLREQRLVHNYRKTVSASQLEGRKGLQSCLRSNQGRERSTSYVSFSSQVTVMEFKNSQEAWAADGWSRYFH